MESSVFSVSIPLLNPNEPEARIVSLAVEEGQFVHDGEVLCTLETTKSTADVIAEGDGFVIALNLTEGDMARAGVLLCFIAETEDWQPEVVQISDISSDEIINGEGIEKEIPAGLRISQPALNLAKSNNLDLTILPVGPLVTENLIRDFLDKSSNLKVKGFDFNTGQIIVYGGGGHGKSVVDTIRAQGVYQILGIVDDGLEPGTSVMGIPVLGGSQILPDLHAQGIRQAVNAVGGIGDISSRIKIFHLLAEQGFVCPAMIHPSAVIETSAVIAPGVQVFPHAYVGSDVKLGFGVIVNTGAVVSHDCSLDDYANVSPGALLAGGVTIGKGSLVGMGVTINLGVTIGENARLGNSATIKTNVPDNRIVRAGMIWPD
jgi:sugar O-acyltransferase (sialic acid O-acetyltransferase NeuD family)